MGISVKEMLDAEFFKEYKILAGKDGLNNQIQGVAILDSEDGFHWSREKEFVISSGYIFMKNPNLFEEYINSKHFKGTACFGIKVGRFLKEIPENIIEQFNKHKIPLIDIPYKDSWMDIMNALNVTVMNKNINRFNIKEINSNKYLDLSYQVRKINKILNAVEYEMNFSAMLYDLSNNKAYYSSNKFKEVSKDLNIEDFWKPSFDYSKEILCKDIKMSRYRFYDSKYEAPFSWITVPITIDNKIKAYFVVIEATGLIDYFDQFSLRIGFLLIQELYEQIFVKQLMEDSQFIKFIENILNDNLKDKDSIINIANDLNISINDKFYTIVMNQTNEKVILSGLRETFKNCTRNAFGFEDYKMSFIEDNSCLFLIKENSGFSEKQNIKLIKEKLSNLKKRLELDIDNLELSFGISDIPDFIYETKKSYQRAEKAISIGKLLYPKEEFCSYSNLGAFAWMDIKDDEVNIMLRDISVLLEDEKYKEYIHTLKVYLECKMNFSLTAKNLYVHINTVRKRIEDITYLLKIDLEDPMNRLKLEILLKLFY